jgi:hypothetical protein
MVDNPDQKIELKTFCDEILKDHQVLATEQANHRNLPQVSSVSQRKILENHLAIKWDVQTIIQTEMERMLDSRN